MPFKKTHNVSITLDNSVQISCSGMDEEVEEDRDNRKKMYKWDYMYLQIYRISSVQQMNDYMSNS